MGMFSLKMIAGVMLVACAIAVQVVVSLPSSIISPSVLNSFIQGGGFLPYAALAPPTYQLLGALQADDMYGTCHDHEHCAITLQVRHVVSPSKGSQSLLIWSHFLTVEVSKDVLCHASTIITTGCSYFLS